jgi:predicted phosphodiesterase
VAYRPNSPLSRADVRDKIIQVALEYSDRGDSSASLVREINGWTGITGVTREALRAAWTRWRDVVPDLPAFGELFSMGAQRGEAYRPADADIDISIARQRLADVQAGRSHTIPAEQVYAGLDVDVSEWDRDDKTEPGVSSVSFEDDLAERMRDGEFRAAYNERTASWEVKTFTSASAPSDSPVQADALERWLLIPDVHVPYHDEAAVSLMLRAAQACGIENCALLGDAVDFYAVSSHDKDPRRRNDLQWEVDEGNRFLDELDRVFPGKRMYVAGNHEDRLRRYLTNVASALFSTTKVEALFRLAERGWSYTPYKEYARIGRLHLTHDTGTAGRYAAHRAMDTFQGNVVIGHTHRMAYVVEGNAKGEAHVGAMLGWLGDVSKVDYMHQVKANRDWAHGFGLAYRDIETDAVHIVPVPIVNGRVVVEGRLVT